MTEPRQLYLRLEETPEFQAEAAARREADRMIGEGFAYVVEHGGWFGGELYRPGGELVKDAKLPQINRQGR
jgi:hypothetical protein